MSDTQLVLKRRATIEVGHLGNAVFITRYPNDEYTSSRLRVYYFRYMTYASLQRLRAICDGLEAGQRVELS